MEMEAGLGPSNGPGSVRSDENGVPASDPGGPTATSKQSKSESQPDDLLPAHHSPATYSGPEERRTQRPLLRDGATPPLSAVASVTLPELSVVRSVYDRGLTQSAERRARFTPMAHKGGDAPDSAGGGRNGMQLKDLVPAATNTVNTTFIVLDKAARPAHAHAQGREETCMSLVADETAAVHFLLWGAECDAFEPGDIVRLTKGIFSYHRGNSLVLRAGKRGRAEKVGEFTMLFVETPNMSELRWAPDPGDPRRMVQEAVVSPYSQVFKPPHS